MNEQLDRFFGDQDIYQVICRYKEMIESNTSCFFDLHEFEEIIDFYIDHDDSVRAFEAVKIAINYYPFSIPLKLKYAKVLTDKGLNAKAIDILKTIERIDVYNYEIHLLKGISFLKLGKQNVAIEEFDKAIKLSREFRDDIVYDIAQSFISLNQLSKAIKYLLLAYELNEKNLLVIYELASCYENLEYWDKSVEYYQKFLEIDPFAENVWFCLGMAYHRLDRMEEALEAFDYAIALNPLYYSAYYGKGEILYKSEDYQRAISVYNEIFESDRENAQALCLIGDCYIKLGKYDTALDYFYKAKFIDECFADAWYGLALVYKKFTQFLYSIGDVNRAINLDDDNCKFWFLKAEIYNEMLKYEEALKAYSKAIEINPDYCEAWLAYASVYYRLNKIDDAIQVLNRSYPHTYDVSTINYQLATYYLCKDQIKLAAEYFEKGLTLNFNEHTQYIDRMEMLFDQQDMHNIISKYQNQH